MCYNIQHRGTLTWNLRCSIPYKVRCSITYNIRCTPTHNVRCSITYNTRCDVMPVFLSACCSVCSHMAPQYAAIQGWILYSLHCTALHCTALHCTALHCTALHCTALHCTALHCTALHCTAPDMQMLPALQTCLCKMYWVMWNVGWTYTISVAFWSFRCRNIGVVGLH